MEVVRKNFIEALPQICKSIEKADFLSIDAEFTGLINGRDGTVFDSPEDYYKGLVAGCSEFMLIQFGLCAFYWDQNRKHYMNDAYNFYLFPRRNPAPERMFLCQSSSLDFLAANGFDFNKLIKEGISYVTEPVETKMRGNLTERQSNNSKEKELLTIPDEHKKQIEDICDSVKVFIKEQKSNEMEIKRVNSFMRMLIFQELRLRFQGEVNVDTKLSDNKSRCMRVTRVTAETEDFEALKKQREWDDLEAAVGFSKVARMISQSEKLVVGHNMLLDLIHTLNHFFQPLPADYKSFKEFAHCMFPKLIDTKYMSSLPPFKDKVNNSSLQELLAVLVEKPFTLPKVGCREGRGYCRRDDKGHEAGYDAYITGLCFLGMHSHLQRMRGEDSARFVDQSAAVKPFLNKIFLAKTARQDSPFMNLAGPDPSPSRDHVFHMTFPKEWQRTDINHLFSPYGPITVQFLDDTTAFVALDWKDKAQEMYRALVRSPRVSIIPFKKFKKNQQRPEPSRVDPYRLTNSPDTRSRQGNQASPRATPQARGVRRRTDSSTGEPVSAKPSTPIRKRTTSGVFEVEESEPAPKKLSLSPTEDTKPVKELDKSATNGKKETADKDQKEPTKKEPKEQKDEGKVDKEENNSKVIDKFDPEAKSSCVAAFKESDTWD